jgi:hypothetical protein
MARYEGMKAVPSSYLLVLLLLIVVVANKSTAVSLGAGKTNGNNNNNRVLLSSSGGTSSDGSSPDEPDTSSTAADDLTSSTRLQKFLSDKGFSSFSNSASSEWAVAADASITRQGSTSSRSSSSSAGTVRGAVAFNVVLQVPGGGGGVGRKMLQFRDEVDLVDKFLGDVSAALGVIRKALTVTSFQGNT